MSEAKSPVGRMIFMASLIISGEAIFSLPFHVTRYFRPTFLDVFGFTNLQLGQAMAAYGVLSMIAYFFGGPLADRFSARALMALSLLGTAVGGLYMATIPSVSGMSLLWGVWGVTTILLFWAALIKATRTWGGADGQGRAFGILDGGRGLLSALMAVIVVLLFKSFMPEDASTATPEQRTVALQNVIYAYVALTGGASILVWFGVSDEAQAVPTEKAPKPSWLNVWQVLKRPTIWMHAFIVIAAYVAYKGTDFFTLFAVNGYGLNEVEAAEIGAISAWVRPIAALAAGLLADRFLSSKVVSGCFLILVATYGFMGLTPPQASAHWLLILEIIITCIAVYGLRGVYFALFEEAALPIGITGTAVGLVSVIGYTPDIFVGLVGGWLVDTYPGVQGHQYFFIFLGGTAFLGLIASLAFTSYARRSRSQATS
ncbi:MAG: MFS transporter [Myxococcales bacterium]|nr:MFS transporter [Myxococcales bacterium]